jgi:hypothetical protein
MCCLKDGSSQGKAGRLGGRELTGVRNINLKPGTLVPVDQEAEAGELLEPRSSRLLGVVGLVPLRHGLSLGEV